MGGYAASARMLVNGAAPAWTIPCPELIAHIAMHCVTRTVHRQITKEISLY